MNGFPLSVLTAFAVLATTVPGAAQIADSPETARTLKKLGTELSREVVGATMKTYGPLLARMPKDGVTVMADLKYGEAERKVLDVYKPADANGTQPILIFGHGGGFVRGDKKAVANLGFYFARHGVVTIAFNYRLAPADSWPSGPEDVAGVMKWIHANPSVHGGNPKKVIVGGHSAGSAHAAAYAMYEQYQIENDGMIGVILVSPPTANLTDHTIDPRRDALYYGTDASTYSDRSYINKLDGRKVPVMIAVGGMDIPLVQSQAGQLIQALYKRDGALPAISTAEGHNHISIVAHFGTTDETLGPDMLEFIKYVSLD